MKDFLLWVHLVVKTLNLEVSLCLLVDYIKVQCNCHMYHYFFLIQPSKSMFAAIIIVVMVIAACSP